MLSEWEAGALAGTRDDEEAAIPPSEPVWPHVALHKMIAVFDSEVVNEGTMHPPPTRCLQACSRYCPARTRPESTKTPPTAGGNMQPNRASVQTRYSLYKQWKIGGNLGLINLAPAIPVTGENYRAAVRRKTRMWMAPLRTVSRRFIIRVRWLVIFRRIGTDDGRVNASTGGRFGKRPLRPALGSFGMTEHTAHAGSWFDENQSVIGVVRITDEKIAAPVRAHVPSVDFGYGAQPAAIGPDRPHGNGPVCKNNFIATAHP